MKKDWGVPMWKTIHYVAASYPKEPSNGDKTNYALFYTTIGDVIPCKPCREHYKKMLEDYPLNDTVLQNQDTLFSWTVFIHNQVNIRLGKRAVSLDEAKKLYYSSSKESRGYGMMKYIILIILILITLYIIKRCKK
jgi:FAD-linked sulfhydryl oxidase